MYNLLDMIQLKTKNRKIPRETIQEVLDAATESILESVEAGNDVHWVGLCKFTYKKKAKTKKEAQNWTEHPYLAEGDKLRFVSEKEGLDAKGGVTKLKKEKVEDKASK